MPLRILYITPYVPNALRARPYNLLKVLTGQHQITVLTPVFSQEEAEDARKLAAELPDLKVVAVPCGKKQAIFHSLLALPRRLPMQARYCYSPTLIAELRRLVQTEHFDLAHVEHFRIAYIGQELARLGLPAVFDSVDCISLLVERTLLNGPLKNRLVSRLELGPTRRYEADILKKGYYRAVCATSGEDAAALEQLAELPSGTVEVVSNGVNASYFAPGDQREADTVVFSGKMSYHANAAAARYFIRNIWPLIRFARPNAVLWVVGSRPPKDLIEVSGKHGIKVTGQVADMRDYLRRASVSVAPMVYSVGIQNKVLEAMACATPVVATGDIQRGIEAENGVALELVAPGHPTDFAGKVVDLLQDPISASALGARGRDFVTTNYTWEKAANRLEQLWQKASGKPKVEEKELVHPSSSKPSSK